MVVRLADVAARAGVSIASASRALSGSPGVSQQVAERVRSVAGSMGYIIDMQARSLAGGTSTVVGLIAGDVRDPYFAEIAGGVIDAARLSSRSVSVRHASSVDDVLTQVQNLRAYRVGAIIIASSGYADPAVEREIEAEFAAFRAGGGAVAVVGRHALRANAVLPDNREGGRMLAEHLHTLGHRRVAILAGPAGLTTVEDRADGVREVFPHAPVFHEAFSRDGGRASTRRALEADPSTTALVALSDVMAAGAYSELRRHGAGIPGSISVAGFDDVTIAVDLAPALTTVRLDMSAMGAAALAWASATEVDRVQRFPAQLVVRASTAAPGHERSTV